MNDAWTFTIDSSMYSELMRHLFPGDHDEHGAVIAAGITSTSRSTRLLARELFKAADRVDFVPGRRGYRMLTPEFVSEKIRYCRDAGLTYLAVHNHGGRGEVEFSTLDNSSHERGYPALLDISGRPVGALVLAEDALAGDIWTLGRSRRPIKETVVLGRNLTRLYPKPPPSPPKADATYDRQVRWFGDRGQALLGDLKVGVIGAGGAGLPLIGMLARIGVGTLVAVDPDHKSSQAGRPATGRHDATADNPRPFWPRRPPLNAQGPPRTPDRQASQPQDQLHSYTEQRNRAGRGHGANRL